MITVVATVVVLSLVGEKSNAWQSYHSSEITAYESYVKSSNNAYEEYQENQKENWQNYWDTRIGAYDAYLDNQENSSLQVDFEDYMYFVENNAWDTYVDTYADDRDSYIDFYADTLEFYLDAQEIAWNDYLDNEENLFLKSYLGAIELNAGEVYGLKILEAWNEYLGVYDSALEAYLELTENFWEEYDYTDFDSRKTDTDFWQTYINVDSRALQAFLRADDNALQNYFDVVSKARTEYLETVANAYESHK